MPGSTKFLLISQGPVSAYLPAFTFVVYVVGKPCWCHGMEMLSTLPALCEGNPPMDCGLRCHIWCDCKLTLDLVLLSVSCWKHVHSASISTFTHAQLKWSCFEDFPESKVHVANMGPIWGRQDPGGPHVDPMNFAIWADIYCFRTLWCPL